jgi:hypothetical protein
MRKESRRGEGGGERGEEEGRRQKRREREEGEGDSGLRIVTICLALLADMFCSFTSFLILT